LKKIDEVLSGLSVEKLASIIMNISHDLIPSKTCPIKDKKCRDNTKALCGIMHVLSSIKAPGT